MAAPLIAGTDLRSASAQTLATYENKGVIAVDQDPLGRQGYPVQDANGLWVLTKPLAGGDRSVVLFNSTGTPATVSTTAAQAGLGAAPTYSLQDLWQGTLTSTTGAISATVPAHGVVMYRVAPSGARYTFSHLHVTPPALLNLVSGPDFPAGQKATLARVSATVTNTGTAAGPGAADLWITAPGAGPVLQASQPVSVAPGHSARVTFPLTGRDLSVWGDAARGWVVPDGVFTISVGGASGRLAVLRSVGARYATIAVPAQAANPDTTVPVSATFTNGGDLPMPGTRFSLRVPTGWTARLTGRAPGYLAPHQDVTLRWLVRVPVAAQGTAAALTAQVSSPGPAGTVNASGSVTVNPALTVTASPVSLTPGQSGTSTVTVTSDLPGPVTLGYTAQPPAGLTVTPAQATLTVPPQGTTATVQVAAAATAPAGPQQIPLSLSFTDGGQRYTLPAAQITASVPYTSFAAAFDNTGISDDTDTGAASLDGSGSSFSAQALASAGVTPGQALTYDGIGFTWPDASAGQPDNVVATGQTIALSGHGADLGLLDTAAYGPVSGTGTLHYTDGSTQSFSLDVPNWYKAAPSGSNAVIVTPYRNRPGNTQDPNVVNVFEQSIPLQAGKTVEAVTLPDIGAVASGSPSLHVFAMAIGG